MFLKELRLKGFKSFANQTTLAFEPGVAVVIGPNGSGKSNLVDAVTWALGEQSPTSLRSASMPDVIFAGSDGHRPLASAEVELTLDNRDHALPLPVDEVSVLRRVGRDGTSHYAINRSPCRLTDVIELLAPLGLGRELHSIIGQGKVEAFLAGKPADRRSQIEEAAGLGAFKRRRERAQHKLKEVRRSLEQVALLEREVSTQLSPLRRQATAAEQRRGIADEVGGLRRALVRYRLRSVEEHLRAAADELAAGERRQHEIEAALDELAVRRQSEQDAFAAKLRERERGAQRLARVRVAATRLAGAGRLVDQRYRLLRESERSALAEQQRLLHELAAAEESQLALDWEPLEAELTRRLSELEAAAESAAAALREASDEVARLNGEIVALGRDRLTLQTEVDRWRQRALERERRREQLRATRATLDGEHSSTAEALTAARENLREATAAAALTVAAARAAEEAAAAAAAAEATTEAERRQAERDLRSLVADIEHLRARLAEVSGLAPQVAAVSAAHPGTEPPEAVLSCSPGYERALAAALVAVGADLTVPPSVDRWSLFGALREAGAGLVRLLVPATAGAPAPSVAGGEALGAHVDAGGHPEIESMLADVVVVEDLTSLPEAFAGLAVTKAGDYYRPASGALGFAAEHAVAQVLARRASLTDLERRLPAAEQAAAEAVVAHDLALAAVAELRETAEVAAADDKRRRGESEAAARDLSRLERRHEELERRRREIDGQESGLADEAHAQEGGEGAAQSQIVDLDAAAAAAKEKLSSADRERAAAGERSAGAETAVTRQRIELEERRAAAEREAARRAEARRRRSEVEARLQALDTRLQRLPQRAEACNELLKRIRALEESAAGLQTELSAAAVAEASPDGRRLEALGERDAELRRQSTESVQAAAAARVELARYDERRTELLAELRAQAPVDERDDGSRSDDDELAPVVAAGPGDDPETPADDDAAAALEQRLGRLEQRLVQIGPVNPLAAAECEELEERAASIREQRRDLERSSDEIDALIADLSAHVEEQFQATFAAVQERFSEMIATLFPGGRGSLELITEGDDETVGVGVQVKPAKKRGQRLQLLSGGERSLVAIAFLMALMLARTSPLYILDEVEAALDDVNIGRLVDLLRRYRERTQFIVITHQKRTMDAADLLYGVTMNPSGASQVVSARMAEEAIDDEQRQAADESAQRSATT